MKKEELLTAIRNGLTQGIVTKNDIVELLQLERLPKQTTTHFSLGFSKVFYFIGALIVFSGISVLIGQSWSQLNPFARVLCTLVFAIVAYVSGELLTKEEKYGVAGTAFHLIAGLTFPIGILVLFYEMGYPVSGAGIQSFVAWLLFLFYVGALLLRKKGIFLFFSIIYGVLFFFGFTTFLIDANPVFTSSTFEEYRLLIIGLSLGFLGYYLSYTRYAHFSEILYGFSTLFSLGAMLLLTDWEPKQNYYWELGFPFMVALALYLSVRLRVNSILLIGTFFLMSYIAKITGEYFSGTLGWPFSLMLCGIAFIGIGYYSFRLHKEYISQ